MILKKFYNQVIEKAWALNPISHFVNDIFQKFANHYIDQKRVIELKDLTKIQQFEYLPLAVHKINKEFLADAPYIMHKGTIQKIQIKFPKLSRILKDPIQIEITGLQIVLKKNVQLLKKLFASASASSSSQYADIQNLIEENIGNAFTDKDSDFQIDQPNHFKNIVKQILSNIKVTINDIQVSILSQEPFNFDLQKDPRTLYKTFLSGQVPKPFYFPVLQIGKIFVENQKINEQEGDKYAAAVKNISLHLVLETEATQAQFFHQEKCEQIEMIGINNANTIVAFEKEQEIKFFLNNQLQTNSKQTVKVDIELPRVECMVDGLQLKILASFASDFQEFQKELLKKVVQQQLMEQRKQKNQFDTFKSTIKKKKNKFPFQNSESTDSHIIQYKEQQQQQQEQEIEEKEEMKKQQENESENEGVENKKQEDEKQEEQEEDVDDQSEPGNQISEQNQEEQKDEMDELFFSIYSQPYFEKNLQMKSSKIVQHLENSTVSNSGNFQSCNNSMVFKSMCKEPSIDKHPMQQSNVLSQQQQQQQDLLDSMINFYEEKQQQKQNGELSNSKLKSSFVNQENEKQGSQNIEKSVESEKVNEENDDNDSKNSESQLFFSLVDFNSKIEQSFNQSTLKKGDQESKEDENLNKIRGEKKLEEQCKDTFHQQQQTVVELQYQIQLSLPSLIVYAYESRLNFSQNNCNCACAGSEQKIEENQQERQKNGFCDDNSCSCGKRRWCFEIDENKKNQKWNDSIKSEFYLCFRLKDLDFFQLNSEGDIFCTVRELDLSQVQKVSKTPSLYQRLQTNDQKSDHGNDNKVEEQEEEQHLCIQTILKICDQNSNISDEGTQKVASLNESYCKYSLLNVRLEETAASKLFDNSGNGTFAGGQNKQKQDGKSPNDLKSFDIFGNFDSEMSKQKELVEQEKSSNLQNDQQNFAKNSNNNSNGSSLIFQKFASSNIHVEPKPILVNANTFQQRLQKCKNSKNAVKVSIVPAEIIQELQIVVEFQPIYAALNSEIVDQVHQILFPLSSYESSIQKSNLFQKENPDFRVKNKNTKHGGSDSKHFSNLMLHKTDSQKEEEERKIEREIERHKTGLDQQIKVQIFVPFAKIAVLTSQSKDPLLHQQRCMCEQLWDLHLQRKKQRKQNKNAKDNFTNLSTNELTQQKAQKSQQKKPNSLNVSKRGSKKLQKNENENETEKEAIINNNQKQNLENKKNYSSSSDTSSQYFESFYNNEQEKISSSAVCENKGCKGFVIQWKNLSAFIDVHPSGATEVALTFEKLDLGIFEVNSQLDLFDSTPLLYFHKLLSLQTQYKKLNEDEAVNNNNNNKNKYQIQNYIKIRIEQSAQQAVIESSCNLDFLNNEDSSSSSYFFQNNLKTLNNKNNISSINNDGNNNIGENNRASNENQYEMKNNFFHHNGTHKNHHNNKASNSPIQPVNLNLEISLAQMDVFLEKHSFKLILALLDSLQKQAQGLAVEKKDLEKNKKQIDSRYKVQLQHQFDMVSERYNREKLKISKLQAVKERAEDEIMSPQQEGQPDNPYKQIKVKSNNQHPNSNDDQFENETEFQSESHFERETLLLKAENKISSISPTPLNVALNFFLDSFSVNIEYCEQYRLSNEGEISKKQKHKSQQQLNKGDPQEQFLNIEDYQKTYIKKERKVCLSDYLLKNINFFNLKSIQQVNKSGGASPQRWEEQQQSTFESYQVKNEQRLKLYTVFSVQSVVLCDFSFDYKPSLSYKQSCTSSQHSQISIPYHKQQQQHHQRQQYDDSEDEPICSESFANVSGIFYLKSIDLIDYQQKPIFISQKHRKAWCEAQNKKNNSQKNEKPLKNYEQLLYSTSHSWMEQIGVPRNEGFIFDNLEFYLDHLHGLHLILSQDIEEQIIKKSEYFSQMPIMVYKLPDIIHFYLTKQRFVYLHKSNGNNNNNVNGSSSNSSSGNNTNAQQQSNIDLSDSHNLIIKFKVDQHSQLVQYFDKHSSTDGPNNDDEDDALSSEEEKQNMKSSDSESSDELLSEMGSQEIEGDQKTKILMSKVVTESKVISSLQVQNLTARLNDFEFRFALNLMEIFAPISPNQSQQQEGNCKTKNCTDQQEQEQEQKEEEVEQRPPNLLNNKNQQFYYQQQQQQMQYRNPYQQNGNDSTDDPASIQDTLLVDADIAWRNIALDLFPVQNSKGYKYSDDDEEQGQFQEIRKKSENQKDGKSNNNHHLNNENEEHCLQQESYVLDNTRSFLLLKSGSISVRKNQLQRAFFKEISYRLLQFRDKNPEWHPSIINIDLRQLGFAEVANLSDLELNIAVENRKGRHNNSQFSLKIMQIDVQLCRDSLEGLIKNIFSLQQLAMLFLKDQETSSRETEIQTKNISNKNKNSGGAGGSSNSSEEDSFEQIDRKGPKTFDRLRVGNFTQLEQFHLQVKGEDQKNNQRTVVKQAFDLQIETISFSLFDGYDFDFDETCSGPMGFLVDYDEEDNDLAIVTEQQFNFQQNNNNNPDLKTLQKDSLKNLELNQDHFTNSNKQELKKNIKKQQIYHQDLRRSIRQRNYHNVVVLKVDQTKLLYSQQGREVAQSSGSKQQQYLQQNSTQQQQQQTDRVSLMVKNCKISHFKKDQQEKYIVRKLQRQSNNSAKLSSSFFAQSSMEEESEENFLVVDFITDTNIDSNHMSEVSMGLCDLELRGDNDLKLLLEKFFASDFAFINHNNLSGGGGYSHQKDSNKNDQQQMKQKNVFQSQQINLNHSNPFQNQAVSQSQSLSHGALQQQYQQEDSEGKLLFNYVYVSSFKIAVKLDVIAINVIDNAIVDFPEICYQKFDRPVTTETLKNDILNNFQVLNLVLEVIQKTFFIRNISNLVNGVTGLIVYPYKNIQEKHGIQKLNILPGIAQGLGNLSNVFKEETENAFSSMAYVFGAAKGGIKKFKQLIGQQKNK